MQRVLILFYFVFSAALLQGQISEDSELRALLNGKTKFYDIKQTVENYYRLKQQTLSVNDTVGIKRINRQQKFWNRFLFEAESHLLPDGTVANTDLQLRQCLNSNPAILRTTSTGGNWSLIGPTSVSSGIGRINRIAFHPTDPLTIYAGSAGGGLFKTTNGGITWSNTGYFLPSLGISGIVVTPGNTIYILTGDGDAEVNAGLTYSYGYIRYSAGVLKSVDDGASWTETAEFPNLTGERYSGLKLVADPNNPNILLAATTRGLFRTTNGGSSWIQCNLLSTVSVDDDRVVYDVEFAPGSSSNVYCTIYNSTSGNGAFLRSTDGGVSFPTLNTVTYSPDTFTGIRRIGIAVTPDAPADVFLLAGPGFSLGNDFKGIWRSTNSGASFTRITTAPNILGASDHPDPSYNDQSDYDLAFAVSPTNSNVLIAGGLVIYKSSNGGFLFFQQTGYSSSTSIHPDVHDLVYNPLNGYLYAGTDGGVAYSTDNGTTWSKIFTGLSCTQFYHFGLQDDGGNIWGGAQDNGVLIRNGSGSSFSNYQGGDGYDVLADLPPAGNQDDKYYSVNKKIYADAIVDEDITPPGADNFFANLAMSPVNEDIIYAGYKSLYVSYSRGSNWAVINTDVVPYRPIPGNWCISSCPTNRKRLYTAGSNANLDGMWRIGNLDDILPDETIDLTGNLEAAGYPAAHPKITDIEVSSQTSNRVWITVGGYTNNAKVFYTNDGGASWSNISNGLPNLPVNCVVADDADNIYIGTDIGVYYRGASDGAWTPFYNDLPKVAVSELELQSIPGGYLVYASTYGRGIWASDQFTTCPASLDINQTLQGQQFYQAGTITSNAVINGVSGTNVGLRASAELILQPGLHAVAGTQLVASIGPCNSGTILFRTADGVDSLIPVSRNIAGARNFGFVHNVKHNSTTIGAEFKIITAGHYIVRLYDADTRTYVYAKPVVFQTGIQELEIKQDPSWGKQLRVDLFRDNALVHYQDAGF